MHASTLADIRIVAAEGANKLWYGTIHAAAVENQTIAQFLMANGVTWGVRGGIETNSSNGDFGAYLGLARGIDGAARAAVWSAGELIRDPYTGAKKGEVSLDAQLPFRDFAVTASVQLQEAQVRFLENVMDYSVYLPAELEIRQGRLGGPSIAGSFAYNRLAVMADRGRVRKESIGSRAFKFAIDEDLTREINVLVGHDFDKNLASRLGGSLDIEDTPAGVNFVAHLPPLDDQPTYMVDAVKQIRGGLLPALSPGFRVPPLSVVPGAETLIPEPGNPSVAIRLIRQAVLGEFSLVARAAYADASTIELRAEDLLAVFPSTDFTRYALWL